MFFRLNLEFIHFRWCNVSALSFTPFLFEEISNSSLSNVILIFSQVKAKTTVSLDNEHDEN